MNGDFHAASAQIGSNLYARGVEFGGTVNLRAAHIEGEALLEGARVAKDQNFDAERIHVGYGGMSLSKVTFGGRVVFLDAVIDGQMNLVEASVAEEQTFQAQRLHVGRGGLYMRRVTFGGPVDLIDAQIDGGMHMEGANIAKDQSFIAQRLHVAPGGLFMGSVTFGGPVDLIDAQIDGRMDMEGATIAKDQSFNASGLRVGPGGLLMSDATFGGRVSLIGAQIDGSMDMEGASIAKDQSFIAERLHVGPGGLSMSNATFGGRVDLWSAHIEGRMSMQKASIAEGQEFSAQQLRIGTGGLSLANATFGGKLDLLNAFVEGQMDLDEAKFAAAFTAQHLHVGLDVIARGATFSGDVTLQLLRLDGVLDLRGSHLRVLHLENASIRDDLTLAGVRTGSPDWVHWEQCDDAAPCLNLRNARVGNLQDDERAWPSRITLEGFTYAHLGGIGGEQRQDMRNRPIAWWRGWLDKDPVYSAQPYAQLAGVLAAAGNRDGAADIRFFGRDRERSELLRGCLAASAWAGGASRRRPAVRAGAMGLGGLSALQLFVGYGIGVYGFRAGAGRWCSALDRHDHPVLRAGRARCRADPVPRRNRAAGRGRSRCCGVSAPASPGAAAGHHQPGVQRVLQRPASASGCYPWQHVAFGVLALCGWALGLFVVAAFSGLIQS